MHVEYVRAVLAISNLFFFFFFNVTLSSCIFCNNSNGGPLPKTSLWLQLQSKLLCPCFCVPSLLLSLPFLKGFSWMSHRSDVTAKLMSSVQLMPEKQCFWNVIPYSTGAEYVKSSSAFVGWIFHCLRSGCFHYRAWVIRGTLVWKGVGGRENHYALPLHSSLVTYRLLTLEAQ